MIQRIQTIYLLLAGAAAFALFGLPFATTNEAVANSQFFTDADFDVQDHIAILVLFVASGALALISIFLFNNRQLQMKLTRISLVANILGIIATTVLFLNNQDPVNANQINDGLGIYLPIAFILFAVLALRGIKKDENLVESSNRLR